MTRAMMFSLIFLIASTVSLASGIIVLQKHIASRNRMFFILATAVAIWSFGKALSCITSDTAACESFMCVSAFGWIMAYAVFLHFVLILTGKIDSPKKWWLLLGLYLPALLCSFVCIAPNRIAPCPFALPEMHGSTDAARNNIWRWIIYLYCIVYTLVGLLLLYQWGRKADNSDKKKASLIISSIVAALALEIVVDVVLKGVFSGLPQMTPVIALIPFFAIYHALNENRTAECLRKKNGTIFLFANVLAYIVLTAVLITVSDYSFSVGSVVLNQTAVRGLIIEIQLILSLFLVMKENRPGFVLAVALNSINLLSMLVLIAKNASAESLPGAVSYLGVLLIIVLIRTYQEKNAAYIEKIDSLNKKLAFDEALYRNVFNQAPVGIAIMQEQSHASSPEFGDITMNPTYARILGREVDELRNLTWIDITHPDDIKTDLEKFNQFKNGEINGYTLEKRFLKPDGSVVYANISISPLTGIYEDHSMHLCLIEDITERKQAELALKESEHRESVLLCHLPGLAYRCYNDEEWTMQYVSDGCLSLTGYAPESLLHNKDLSFNDIISPEYRQLLRDEWERILAARLPFKYEYEIITASGERKWVIEMGQGIYNDAGEVEELEGIVLDISDRKAAEDHLRYINEHNTLTGLYNRSYLETLLKKDLNKKDGFKKAVISINLSTVQLLTANYGFQYTQNIIKDAAEALGRHCTVNRMLFQTYDNQFVFYVKGYQDKLELVDFCEKIAKNMESLFVADRIGGGIGVLEIGRSDAETDVEALLRKLLIASEKSINLFERDFGICFYDEELEALLNREKSIRRALSAIALSENDEELFLQYQPVFDLKTNTVCSFEALARLNTDELGPVSPAEFIPIAEKTKLIVPIGDRIFIKAFRFLNKLKELGYDDISVSINISAVQLLQPGFTSRLLELISEMQVNPRNIDIEITESLFVSDYEKVNNIIERLRASGLHISIDDFGIGYSSLARLRELKVDCLKLDKYFIDKLMDADISKTIINDIISMSHKLDRCVIAEGIEHERQLQYLKDYNCDRIQGHFISKPLDEKDAFDFLQCNASPKATAV